MRIKLVEYNLLTDLDVQLHAFDSCKLKSGRAGLASEGQKDLLLSDNLSNMAKCSISM